MQEVYIAVLGLCLLDGEMIVNCGNHLEKGIIQSFYEYVSI